MASIHDEVLRCPAYQSRGIAECMPKGSNKFLCFLTLLRLQHVVFGKLFLRYHRIIESVVAETLMALDPCVTKR